MKILKFGIFAVAMGLFVASCGDNAANDGETADTTTVINNTEVVEPAPAPAPMDTTTAAPATTDTTTVAH